MLPGKSGQRADRGEGIRRGPANGYGFNLTMTDIGKPAMGNALRPKALFLSIIGSAPMDGVGRPFYRLPYLLRSYELIRFRWN